MSQLSASAAAFDEAKGTWYEAHDDELVMAAPVAAILDALVVLEGNGYTTNFERGVLAIYRPAGQPVYTGDLSDTRIDGFVETLEPDAAAALRTVRAQLLTTPFVKEGSQNLLSPIRRIDLLAPSTNDATGEIKVVLACLAIMYTVGCKVSDPAMLLDDFLGYVTEAERTVVMRARLTL